MTLQDFLIAGYERRVHGTPCPEGRSESDLVAAMKADPAMADEARAKLAEYDALIEARRREACFTSATYRDVLASALMLLAAEP